MNNTLCCQVRSFSFLLMLLPIMLVAQTKTDVLIAIGMTDYEYSNYQFCDVGPWTDDEGNVLEGCGVGLSPFMGDYVSTCDSLEREYLAGNKNIVKITSGLKVLFPQLFERQESEFDIDFRLPLADFNVFYLPDSCIYVRDITNDVEPVFPGGNKGLMDFISTNIRYPQVPLEAGIQGTVIVSFVVDTDGSITDATVVKSVENYLDWEARRIVRHLPNFAPGIRNGRPSRFKFNIPVKFTLN